MAIRQPRVNKRRQVTIPRELLKEAGLSEGQPLLIRATGEGLLITAGEERDPDQWWFWTEEWQAKEREADADYAAGRSTLHLSTADFLAELDRIDAELTAFGQ